jgi:hypothetical protein
VGGAVVLDHVVHARGELQPRAARAVREHDPQVVRSDQAALEHVDQRGRRPRILLLRHRVLLVGDQIRLERDAQRLPDRLDLVRDRRHAAKVERHQAATAHPHCVVGLRRPLESPLEHARPQVEQALVVLERAAVNIERFVLDQPG